MQQILNRQHAKARKQHSLAFNDLPVAIWQPVVLQPDEHTVRYG
jgi:hypothetical protein